MNRITTYLNSLGRTSRAVLVGLAVIFTGAGITQAATTISTSVLTNGALDVTGVSTFGATASTTISTAGVLTTPSAIVNGTLKALGAVTFGATASTTISTAGVLTAPSAIVNGTLAVIGVSSFGATATSTFGADGSLTIGTFSNLSVTGSTTVASTTATTFKVGQVGTQLSRIVAGYCVTGTVTLTAQSAASSTQTYANCSPFTAAGTAITLTSSDRVFVQATSSLPYFIVVQSASSTTNAINIGLTNFSTSTPSAAVYAFNFWAFQ